MTARRLEDRKRRNRKLHQPPLLAERNRDAPQLWPRATRLARFAFDGLGSAPVGGRRRRRCSDRPVWIFLAQGRLTAKTLVYGGSKTWISLDSLVRVVTYQLVTRIFREKKFSSPFPAAAAPERAPGPLAIRTAQDCSSRKRNLISVFLQQTVAVLSAAVGRALAQLGVEPIRRRRAGARSGRSGRCRIVWSRSSGSPPSPASRRPTPSFARSICRSATPLRRRSGRRGLGLHADPGRQSRRDPRGRRGNVSRKRQLRILPDGETADPRKPDVSPFRQGEGEGPTPRLPRTPLHGPI